MKSVSHWKPLTTSLILIAGVSALMGILTFFIFFALPLISTCLINVKPQLSGPEGRNGASSFSLRFLDAEFCWQLLRAFPWIGSGRDMKLLPSLKSAQLLGWFWITAVKVTTVLLVSSYCYLANRVMKAESLKPFDVFWNKVLYFYLVIVGKTWSKRYYVWVLV